MVCHCCLARTQKFVSKVAGLELTDSWFLAWCFNHLAVLDVRYLDMSHNLNKSKTYWHRMAVSQYSSNLGMHSVMEDRELRAGGYDD